MVAVPAPVSEQADDELSLIKEGSLLCAAGSLLWSVTPVHTAGDVAVQQVGLVPISNAPI